jgi:hypothetical protein
MSNTVKIEFLSNSSNSFNIHDTTQKHFIPCIGKGSCQIDKKYFTTEYQFIINTLTLKIDSIVFINITHVDVINNNIITVITNFDTINDNFEYNIYNALCYILNNAIITKIDDDFCVKISNISTNIIINYLLLYIKIDTTIWLDSSDKQSISNKIIKNKNKIKKLKNKINKSDISMLKLASWSSSLSFLMHVLQSKS